MEKIKRTTDIANLENLISHFPIVILYGPRRIGKTSLAKELESNKYFTLHEATNKDIIINDITNSTGLIIIDEIQFNFDLIPKIRQITDSNRDVKFLLLGSSPNLILHNTKFSIAGRAAYYELSGLKLSDINFNINKHIIRGGFPYSYVVDDDLISFKLRNDYLSSTIYKDLLDSGLKFSSHIVFQLLDIIAHLSGSRINKSSIANQISVAKSTLDTYLQFFEGISMIRVIESSNRIKNSKIYIRDSGLLNSLLQVKTFDNFSSSTSLHNVWESYIIESIINEYNPDRVSFDIDQLGNEIDLIFEKDRTINGIICNYKGNKILREPLNKLILRNNIQSLFIVNNVHKNEQAGNNIFFTTLDKLSLLLTGKLPNLKQQLVESPIVIKSKKTVFISYSHKDTDFVLRLKHELEKQQIGIVIDIETLKFGDDIKDFISKSTRITDYTIQVVSINSLRSPYVMIEYLEAQMHETITRKKKFIPIFIDRTIFEDEKYIELADDIQKEIEVVNRNIEKAITRNLPASPLTSKRDRLLDLKSNLGRAIENLRNSLVGDFSALTPENLDKLIKVINE